jgi:hypothetical protein
MLSADFTFLFPPSDTEEPRAMWDRAHEILSAQRLFSRAIANRDGYVARDLSLAFELGPEIPNDRNGWTKIALRNVRLALLTRRETTGDSLDYVVAGDASNLWFVQDGPTWRIVRWADEGGRSGLAPIEPCYWGQIKGLWYP